MRLSSVVLVTLFVVSGCGGSSSQKSTVPPTDGITGFGATTAVWNATHRADTSNKKPAGLYYNPDPSLVRGSDKNSNDKYFSVSQDGGRTSEYNVRFPRGTTIAQAQRMMRKEFPADAKTARLKTRDTCALMNVRSGKIARAMGGDPVVEFSSGPNQETYDPKDVWSAYVTLGPMTTC